MAKSFVQTDGSRPKPVITQEQFNSMLNDPRMASVPPNEAVAYFESRGFELQGVKKMGPAPSTQYSQTKGPSFVGNVGKSIAQTAVQGIKNIGTGLFEQAKESFVEPFQQGGSFSDIAQGKKFTWEGNAQDTPIGEGFTKAASGGLQTLFAPVSGLLQNVPGGEKLADLSALPREAVGEIYEFAAKKAGVDISNPGFQEAKEQMMTAFDVGATAFGPKVARKSSDWMKTKLSTMKDKAQVSKVESVISGRLSELDKLEGSNSVVRKAIKDADSKGVDVKQLVSETDLLKDAVDKDGTIRTSQEGGAIEQLNEFIKPQENVIGRVLEKEGKTMNLKDLEAQMKAALEESKIVGANKKAALQAIANEIEGLALDADKAGNIKLSKIQDAKISKYSTINYADPVSKITDKLIAKTLKKAVEKSADSVDVAKLNKELGSHYAVLKFLEKLDGKKVKGGRLGKYFGKTIGAIAGSALGPLGALLGSEAGGLIQGKIMARTFKGETGKALQSSESMKSALSALDEGPPKDFKSAGTATSATIKVPPEEFQALIEKAQTSDKSLTHHELDELKTLQTKLLQNKEAGYAYKINGDVMELSNVFTNPKARGKGYGSQAMQAVIDEAIGEGVKSIKLDAYKYLEPFYEKFGFKTVDEIKFDPKFSGGFDPRIKGSEGLHNIIYMELKL